MVGLAFSHAGLVVENIHLFFGAVTRQVGTFLQVTVPLQTSITDLIHAYQLRVVVHWSLRRARLAFLEGLIPNRSVLRANLTSHLGLVPNRLDVIALLGSHLLALLSDIIELSASRTHHLTFQGSCVPLGPLSTRRHHALLSC